MRVYDTIIRTSITAAVAVVILIITLTVVVAVTMTSALAVLLAVSAVSFVTGFMGAIGMVVWMNRVRINNPKFLARAEAKAREKDTLISATIIDKTGTRGGGGSNGIPGYHPGRQDRLADGEILYHRSAIEGQSVPVRDRV